MRPEDTPFKFHTDIHDAYSELRRFRKEYPDAPFPAHMPAEIWDGKYLRETVQKGLGNGDFKDTSRIRHWIGVINRFARFKENGLPRLVIKNINAEKSMTRIRETVEKERNHPAGTIFSGSPLMLSKTLYTNPAVAEADRFASFLLDEQIPTLGICFGMHLLAHARFGFMVKDLENPKTTTHRLVSSHPKIVEPVEPQAKRMAFGPWEIRPFNNDDPIMKLVNNVLALEVHSQYVPFNSSIPMDKVLAASSREFVRIDENEEISFSDLQIIAEVIKFSSYAYGLQFHPEFTPRMILILSYIHEYKEQLEAEGLNLSRLRKFLKDYDLLTQMDGGGYYPGERYGYNWVKYVLLPKYLRYLYNHEQTTSAQKYHIQAVFEKLIHGNYNLRESL